MAELSHPVPPAAGNGHEGTKKAFLFYTNWYTDCAAGLSDDDLSRFLLVVVRYASFGTLPDDTVPAVVRSMFGLVRPAIDADLLKYEQAAERRREQAANRSKKAAEKRRTLCAGNQRTTPQQPLILNPESSILNPESLSEKEKKKEEARPRFEEIEAYWQQRQMKSSAREFFDFYEHRDWLGVSGGRIQSWKKAALMWEDKFRRDVLPLRRREEAAAKVERRREQSRENERIRTEQRLAREAEDEQRAARAVDHHLGLHMYHRALDLCHGDAAQAMSLTRQASTDPAVFDQLREGFEPPS